MQGYVHFNNPLSFRSVHNKLRPYCAWLQRAFGTAAENRANCTKEDDYFEDGDLPCDAISSVDSFTWKCSVAPDHWGIHRLPMKHPAKVVVPDLKITCSQKEDVFPRWADAARKWFVAGEVK